MLMYVYGLNPKMNKKMSEFPTMEKMNKLEEKGKWKVERKRKKKKGKEKTCCPC